MRRTNNNYSYQPLSQRPPAQSSNDTLEEENEYAADDLKNKISALKSISIDIGNEVRYQDKILKGLDDDMDRTGGFLGTTMGRVLRLTKHGGNRHMCYMILFVLFVFLILWIVLKFR